MKNTRGVEIPGRADEDFVDGLHVGDAIRFFLDAKRAGGRSERTISEYRKKLDLFQRWAAAHLEGEGAVDAPVTWVGPDEVEGYVVHMRGRGLSDTSIKNHLSVLRSLFDTLARRLELPDPTRRLDEVRFHQKAPKRTFLTRREADVLLGAIESRVSGRTDDAGSGDGQGGVWASPQPIEDDRHVGVEVRVHAQDDAPLVRHRLLSRRHRSSSRQGCPLLCAPEAKRRAVL